MARRKSIPTRNAVLASARPINLSNARQAAKQLASRPDWHEVAWQYFDTTPEVSQPVAYLGNQLAKIRLYPALADPDDPSAPPQPLNFESNVVSKAVTGVEDTKPIDDTINCTQEQWVEAWAELNRLHSSSGGLSEILRAANMNLEVIGEFYLVGLAANSVTTPGLDGQAIVTERFEEWMVCSTEEVKIVSGKIRVTVDWASDPVALTPNDFLIRIWVRHPRDKRVAYAPMQALLADCKALRSLTAQGIAEAQSHVPAGLLAVPNELVFGDGTTSMGPDDGNDSEQPPGTEPFMLSLATLLEETIDDPSAPGAYSPAAVRGPAEALAGLKLISLARTHDPTLEPRIQGHITRIARGMNLPMEKALGHTETTFANGRAIDLDEYEDYHAPRASLLMDALTVGFYRPQCSQNTLLADLAPRLMLACDPSALFGQPDPVANSSDAHDRLLISDAKARELYGFTEDDAPTPEELVMRLAIRRGMFSTDMTSPMLQALLHEAGIDNVPLVPLGPSASAPRSSSGVSPLTAMFWDIMNRDAGPQPPRTPPALNTGSIVASSRVQSKIGRQLAAIDRDLMTRLLIASSAAMTRALDKAGAKLSNGTTKTEKTLVARVPKYQIAATLGRPRVEAIIAASGDPLEGAWTDLEADFMRWGGQAQSDALDAAGRVASGLSADDRTALRMRQADSLTEAWGWMREALDSLAGIRLFDPDPQLTVGEVDPNLRVPPGLVREAIARAGGEVGFVSGADNGQWVALLPDGGPVGGIGTGTLVSGVLRDSGGQIEAYIWDYGPGYRFRPFQEHLDLDGETFANFDSDVLANDSGWPPYTFYTPGDHENCQCSATPTWVFAGEEG